jgi:hypothetical protein
VLVMVLHTYNCSIREDKAEGSEVQCQPRLHSETLP